MSDEHHDEEFPIDGELDLHIFKPNEVKSLVPEYLRECHQRGIYSVRIIHGKGTGVLRGIVHSILEKHPLVADYRIGGSWGYTVADLDPNADSSEL